MNLLGKILVLLALIVAIIASFVKFPYSSLILVVLGLVIGFISVKLKDLQVCVLSALGLALGMTILTYFGDIAAILSEILTAIFGNILTIVSAVVLALVLRYLVSYIFKK